MAANYLDREPITLESPDFGFSSMTSNSNIFSSTFGSVAKGFGSGLNILGGISGLIESNELDNASEEELQSNLQQDQDLQQQNVQSYISASSASMVKLSGVLGNLRAAAAGFGTKMDGSGMIQEMVQRNLSAESKDQLSASLNFSFENQKILDKEKADRQRASAQEDSDFWGGIGSFFQAGVGIAGAAAFL